MASVETDSSSRPRLDRPPRDEEIKASKVYMVRPEDNRLTDPIPLYDVLELRQRDEKGRPVQFLQEVSPMNVEELRYHPICKMFDKKATREAEVAKRKKGKESKIQTKQLELNWSVTDNDLSHRLARLKEFLEKGWKVDILFGVKRKGWMGRKEATKEDVARVLERIRRAVEEVDGAKERKGMQGKEGGEAMLSYEGKIKK